MYNYICIFVCRYVCIDRLYFTYGGKANVVEPYLVNRGEEHTGIYFTILRSFLLVRFASFFNNENTQLGNKSNHTVTVP